MRMKLIKNYILTFAMLSLSVNTFPLQYHVPAVNAGTPVSRKVNKQIKRHKSAIAKNNKKLSSKKLDNELDAELKKQRKQELLNSNREHEEAIQDLMKK